MFSALFELVLGSSLDFKWIDSAQFRFLIDILEAVNDILSIVIRPLHFLYSLLEIKVWYTGGDLDKLLVGPLILYRSAEASDRSKRRVALNDAEFNRFQFLLVGSFGVGVSAKLGYLVLVIEIWIFDNSIDPGSNTVQLPLDDRFLFLENSPLPLLGLFHFIECGIFLFFTQLYALDLDSLVLIVGRTYMISHIQIVVGAEINIEFRLY